MKYKHGQTVEISVERSESNFDRACEEAYKLAAYRFGVDENGNITNVEDSGRTTDSLVVEFKKYRWYGGYCGSSHVYQFLAWVERGE